jgi:cytochrome c553
MADVASFYAGQRIRPDPVVADAEAVARGREVYLRSLPIMGRPNCATCHDGSGTRGGMMGGRGMPMMGMGGMVGATGPIPRLRGQHAAYLLTQLRRFVSGERPSTAMGPIAAALTDSDRSVVAAYLAQAPASR